MKAAAFVRSVVSGAARWGNLAGCALLFFMALLITTDVLARSLADTSIPGVFEVVEVCMGAMVGCGLAFTGVTHSHLDVEIVTELMPPRARSILRAFGNMLGFLFCAAAGVKTLSLALDAFSNRECTPTTSLLTGPFIFLLGLGFLLLAVVFLVHVHEESKISKEVRHDR
ncbi:TRAP transporter small permease [Mailhella massiliensis]|uniref:TRAP transporter small permease n=1 Tax=Mailhella massiliensis TaxID=1903261 RepID=A0A921ATY5_9BACT|nr:TRAP transporter small permease [Mailhella massiliensis]HJD96342.1 TRAP transporter small permease [Mailhella massiliensis]